MQNLGSIIEGHPDDATALVEPDRTTTYGELRLLVDRTRAGLVAHGLEPGDRVAIICGNDRASVIALLACLGAGMVAVPLHPMSPLLELQREIDAVGARIVLTGRATDPALHPVVAVPAGVEVDGIEPLPDGEPVPIDDVEADRLALLMFTSGTAGSPKAAMLSHGNLAFVQQAIIDHPGAQHGPSSVVLAVVPLAHIYGLNVSLLTTLRVGASVVLLDRFDPQTVVDTVVQHGVTLFAGVPPMWRRMLDLDHVPSDAFASIERMTSGASALSVSLWERFRDRFGIELSEGYGLTETASVVSTHIGCPVRPGSVGQPLPGVEVAVVDHDDLPAPPDDSGAVKVRGPNVFQGYWNDEEATKAVLDPDGWLHTGDVGVQGENGYLSLVDRAKDLIIVSGFNVFPFEVEAVLLRHPSVDEVVVIGREDERRGERVVAYVIPTDPARPPTLDELVDHCRLELARYKCPSELHVVDELPIAASGKRIRRELA